MSEGELRSFLNELKKQGEKWNALKLVVLGHGEVGKTTLIHAIRRCTDPSRLSRVSTTSNSLTKRWKKRRQSLFFSVRSLTGLVGCGQAQVANQRCCTRQNSRSGLVNDEVGRWRGLSVGLWRPAWVRCHPPDAALCWGNPRTLAHKTLTFN